MDLSPRVIAAAGRGDEVALNELVERCERPVYSVCYRMLGNAEDAADATQETFLKAVRSLHRYDPSRPFSTWILSIAAHECIDRLRRRGPVVSLDAMPEWRWRPAETPDPETEAVAADEAERMARLLQALPPEYRIILVLRYWHDLGYEEIAAVLGDTVSAVKSRLHRARRQLAEMLTAPAAGRAAEGTAASPGPGVVELERKGGVQPWHALKPAG